MVGSVAVIGGESAGVAEMLGALQAQIVGLTGRVEQLAIGGVAVGNDTGVAVATADGTQVGTESTGSTSGGDEVENGIVAMPAGPGEAKPPGLYFGSIDSHPGAVVATGGFYATVVRSAAAVAYLKQLQECIGVRIPKSAKPDFVLTMYPVNGVPAGFEGGGDRLRVLALLGGSAMQTAYTADAYLKQCSAATVSKAVQANLANPVLATLVRRSKLIEHLVGAAMLGDVPDRTALDFLRAIAGAVSLWRAPTVLHRYMVQLGVTLV